MRLSLLINLEMKFKMKSKVLQIKKEKKGKQLKRLLERMKYISKSNQLKKKWRKNSKIS